jgi:hypothetical protein
LKLLGCSSGSGAAELSAAVAARRRGGTVQGNHIRSLAGRQASMALGSKSVVVKRLCRWLGSKLVRHNRRSAVVLAAPCAAFVVAGRIDKVSLSCTGLGVFEEETGCVQHRAQPQAGLCAVVEAVALATAVPRTNHSTAYSSHLAVD